MLKKTSDEVHRNVARSTGPDHSCSSRSGQAKYADNAGVSPSYRLHAGHSSQNNQGERCCQLTWLNTTGVHHLVVISPYHIRCTSPYNGGYTHVVIDQEIENEIRCVAKYFLPFGAQAVQST